MNTTTQNNVASAIEKLNVVMKIQNNRGSIAVSNDAFAVDFFDLDGGITAIDVIEAIAREYTIDIPSAADWILEGLVCDAKYYKEDENEQF